MTAEESGASRRVGTLSTGVLSSSATGVEIGTQVLGTFEIVEHVATGGMGEVYRGINIHTQEPVAIKIVLASLAHDDKILSLFQKEATVLGRLHHEAIVRYQLFTIDPVIRRACLIMEYVAGQALSDRLLDGPVPLDEVRALLHRLASGLQKAHDLGVIHRDLSPDNVIITDGHVSHAKIIDFGIAKSANFGGGTLLGGQFAGKFNYVSPEQLGRFKGIITPRSDIYSLALVIAAACRGEPIDMGESPAEAVESRMSVPALDGVYPELRPLLEQMLQPDPEARPADMTAVIAALDGTVLPSGPAAPAAKAAPVAPEAERPRDTVVPPPEPSQPPAFRFTDAPRSGSGTVMASPPPVTGAPEAPPGPPPSTSAMTVMSAPPPRSVLPQAGAADAGATVFAPSATPYAATPASTPPAARVGADDSPFGAVPQAAPPQPAEARAPAQTRPAAPVSEPEPAAPEPPAKRKRSALVPVVSVAVLFLVAGAAAWLGGAFSARSPDGASPEAVAAVPAPATRPAAPEPARPATGQAVATPPESGGEAATAAPVEAAAPASNTPEAEETAAPPPQRVPSGAGASATAAARPPAPAHGQSEMEVAALADKVLETGAPPKAEAAGPAPTRAETLSPRKAWLAAYAMPECSYARPLDETPESFSIEGFGVTVEPFVGLDQAYTAAHGGEAQIGLRKVTEAQCPAVDFVRQAVGPDRAPIPMLEIEGDVLVPGEATPLHGRLAGVDGLALKLILVDDRGGTYDITRLLRSGADGEPVFDLAVQVGAREDGPEFRPNLILAVATPTALDAVEIEAGDPVGAVLEEIDRALQERGEDAVAALGYFRLEGT